MLEKIISQLMHGHAYGSLVLVMIRHLGYRFICEVRDLNPRSRAWEARTLTSLG